MKSVYILLAVVGLLAGILGLLITQTFAQTAAPTGTPAPANEMITPIERDLRTRHSARTHQHDLGEYRCA